MKVYLEPAEVESLQAQAACVRDRLLIRVLFHLGCRISEALLIKVEDIDFVQGKITIEHLKTRSHLSCPGCGTRVGKIHNFCPGCGTEVKDATTQDREHRRVRTLPLDYETLHMLKEYIDHGGPVVRNGATLVFGVHRHRGWQIVRDCAQRAGLSQLVNPETGKTRGISPHRLRDAFAVMAAKTDDSGDGLRLLQEHLGHASFNTTAKYRKVAGEELREWYSKLWKK